MIRLEELRVRAGDFSLAIDELSVVPGEYVMVLGPTASGKTVLLETVAGLRRPQGGSVWFGERNVTVESPENRGAGLVYQDYALFPHLTVAENIAFGLRWRRRVGSLGDIRRERASGLSERRSGGVRVRELAGMLGIEGLLARYPHGLSGGERQRVALARALAIEPEILLLDEPLAALDGPTRFELQAELGRMHKDLGATVLHVTHDLDEALALGDKIAVLMQGSLRQVGTPAEVTRRPADAEVARLVGQRNILSVAGVDEATEVAPCCAGERLIRLRLEAGRELVGRRAAPVAAEGLLVAVIPAEEIEMEALEGGSSVSHGGGHPESSGVDNVMDAVVTAFRVHSVHSAVQVEVTPDEPGVLPLVLAVHVLRPQVERMGLSVGSRVRLRVRPSAVHVCPAGAVKS